MWGCVGSQSGVLNSEYADHDLPSGEAQPLAWGWLAVPSAPEHPLWESETLGVISTEDAVSVHLNRQVVTRRITYKSQKRGWGAVSWERGSPLSQVMSEEDREQGTSTYDLQGGQGGGH